MDNIIQTSSFQNIETPVKKSKPQISTQNTAESQCIDIDQNFDPIYLFENFEQIMKISFPNLEIPFDKEDIYKKLQYHQQIFKLNFEDKNSSMKKKPKNDLKQSIKCIQLFPMEKQKQIQIIEQLNQDKENNTRCQTPPKKQYISKNIELTPIKNYPFRQMNNS